MQYANKLPQTMRSASSFVVNANKMLFDGLMVGNAIKDNDSEN